MADVYHMKALRTFYGTGGYIFAGQEFFTNSKEQADMYVQEEIALYTDGTEFGTDTEQEQDIVNQNTVYTSQLERNVTSMANPVNLRISVQGMNPEDLTVEIVRDQGVQPQTMTVEPTEQPQVQPSSQQQYQGGHVQQQAQPSAQKVPQNQMPSQELSQHNEDPQNTDLGEAGSVKQQKQAGYDAAPQASEVPSQPSNGNGNENEKGNEKVKSLEEKEAQLLQQLEELRAQKEQVSQSQIQEHGSPFEAKHVGGGWYDLPNGERIQGKQNAEMRMQELIQAYHEQEQAKQQQGQVQGNGYQPRMVGQAQFPNPDRVRQANYHPEDGAQLNQAGVDFIAQQYQGQGNVQAQGQQGNGSGMAQGLNQSGDQRGMNAQFQSRNSEGEFQSGSQGANRDGSVGASGTGNGGSRGNTGGASTANNTGGGNTGGNGGSGGNTSGPNSGSGGRASTSGNTGQ